MQTFFAQLLEGRRFVSIVGAGGKSSLMGFLADMLARQGKRTAVITSTRIFRPDGYCADIAACEQRFSAGEYAVCGTVAENGKLALPAPEVLAWLMHGADVILCEADGAKKMACKAPAEHEPVILPQSDLVIGVMGLDVLGGEVDTVCFRPERVRALLGCSGDHRLTEGDMARILLSPQGTRKHVGERAYCVVLNKCDDDARRAAGESILSLLAQQGQTCAALTRFR